MNLQPLNVGIAFAIPINMARRIGMQIYQHGRMRRGSLGLETRDISSTLAAELNLPTRRGATITSVATGSAAAHAGVRSGCIIISVNGEAVRNNSDYMAQFGSSVIGEQVLFQLRCEGTTKLVKFTVNEHVSDPRVAAVAKDVRAVGGIVVSKLEPRSPLYGQLQGVIVRSTEPDSPAAAPGLGAGDVILSINQLTISSATQILVLVNSDVVIDRVKFTRGGLQYIAEWVTASTTSTAPLRLRQRRRTAPILRDATQVSKQPAFPYPSSPKVSSGALPPHVPRFCR